MARVAEGRDEFGEILATTPFKEQRFLVSMTGLTDAQSALGKLKADGIHPSRVFVWVYNEQFESIPPIVATFMEEGPFDFTDPASAVLAMEEDVLFNLQAYANDLAAGPDEEEPDPETVVSYADQLNEANQLLEQVKSEGLRVFGFECVCSASVLAQLDGVRVAELEPDSELPVKPSYPFEERLLGQGVGQ